MAIKMVIVLMVSRLRRRSALAIVLLGSAFLTIACQKVPLLAPSGSTITLIASATALPINGSTDIIAQLIEPAGTPPHAGTRVTFTTNLGTIQPAEAETDISGRVVVKFIAGSGSGVATITAISGGVSASGANAIKISVGTAAVGAISLSANPTSLSAAGGTSTIVALVTDSSGNPIANVPVTFSTDNGSLSSSLVTTDSTGHAQTQLTTGRTAKVTATAGVSSTSGTTTTTAPSSSVTVTVNASATITLGAPSPANPVAGQTVTVTLTVTASTTGGAVRQVIVNWGDGTAQQTLGAISGATTLSHTYTAPGTYTVTATATDANGDTFPAVTTITVGNRPPATVAIAVSPTSPQVGQQVTFTVTTTFPVSNTALVQNVTLDFGDGTPQAQLGSQSPATAQHVYTTAGTYTVTAVVRDTNGGTSSSGTQIFVNPKPPPTMTFIVEPSSGPVTTNFRFTATVTVPTGASVTVDHFEWNFDDGSPIRSTSSNSTNHVYAVPKTYVPSVTAVMSDGTRITSSTEVRVTAT
jgi:PKD repeat protein